MGTIADKLTRIITTKEDIRQALISKGYDVPTSIPFKEYAKMISDLPCRVDSFPDIEGIVARYSALGLTNEQMAANPVWVDKTSNGHDLQMKNFIWGGMSGVGGYKLNWGDSSIWVNYITQGTFGTGEVTDNTIHITSAKTNNALFETRASLKSVEYKVLIKGLTDDIYLRYGVFNDGKELWTEIKNDGIYTLPSYDYDSRYNMKWKVMSQTYPIDCNITIEQLPLYPGFILGDGVDDFAVTEKELNFEDTYTVYTAFIPFQNDPARNMILCGKNDTKDFSINYSGTHLNFKPSTGVNLAVRIDQFTLLVCKRNKDITTIINLSTGESRSLKSVEFISNPGLYYLWRNMFATFHAKAAIAGQTICNGYFSTDEDDEKVLDWYKKQYPWLFPNQAWTVVGKTNEDEDRATIANITGNGNDLVLSNFGFAEGSGYGLYAENYAGGRWVQSTDRADLTWTSYSVNITSVKVASTQLYYQSYPEQPSFTVSSYKIKVYGLKDGQTLSYKQVTSEGQQIYKISEDGIYTLPSFLFKANGDWYGFTLDKIQETCDITIEQIPEYEGYLVTDGVDDKAVSKQFKFGENFTVILDFKFPVKKRSYCGFDLSSKVRIQNLQGSGVYVVLKGNKTLIPSNVVRAVTSEGKVYDENWNEYNIVPGNISSNYTMVNLGFDGSIQFAESATKLAGIYSSTLSKDDCIKAYNYLQTLKSK